MSMSMKTTLISNQNNYSYLQASSILNGELDLDTSYDFSENIVVAYIKIN